MVPDILPMGSVVVNVMVTLSFAFAKDELVLLLDIVRFTKDGSIVSISTLFPVIFSGVTLNTFPVLSYAVMVNSTYPMSVNDAVASADVHCISSQ